MNLLVGKSGFELASLVLEKAYGADSGVRLIGTPPFRFEKSPEYWTGWALSYFQWESGRTFSQIQTAVPITEVRDMYEPFHEMDIRWSSDRMHRILRERQADTQLKRLRIYAGLTQKTLAEKTGIPIRTVQQYEQRQKNISKASGQYLQQFAAALNCRMEDLMDSP